MIRVWEQLSSFYLWNAFPLDGKENRLFQVVGVPRSGTTLLCSMLNSHSKIICLSEPYHQWKYDGFVYTDEICELVHSNTWKRHPAILLKFLLRNVNDKLIGFKEIYYSKYNGHYSNHFFFKRNYQKGVVTIAIIRDPREVWKSLVLKHPEKRGRVTRRFVESWNDLVCWILENNIFWVRYEDLVDNPENELCKVCDFLGVDFEEDMFILKERKARGDLNALKGGNIIEGRNKEYKKVLSLREINYIEFKCDRFMKLTGYK